MTRRSWVILKRSARSTSGSSDAPHGKKPGGKARASNRDEFKDAERERILSALTACNWNRAQAAKTIGLPRRTFYRRLKEFGIL